MFLLITIVIENKGQVFKILTWIDISWKLLRKQMKQKMILHSRIAILLLKGSFKTEKIIFHKKNLKHRKI